MHERDMIIGANHVSKRRQSLFDTLDPHAVGKAVAQMGELLVGRARGHEQAAPVACRQPSDDASARDGGMDGRNDILQFGFKDAGSW